MSQGGSHNSVDIQVRTFDIAEQCFVRALICMKAR